MIKRLQKNHQILCTSRNYREVNQLSKILKMKLIFVGKHGGSQKVHKLHASINRISHLTKIIKKFSPDVTISFCSPEASRIAYGLDVKHIAFSDSPHAKAVMQLSLPFVQKLLIPWVIPKNEFIKFGISVKNIIQYKAIDASVIVKQNSLKKTKQSLKKTKKKTILIRVEEEQAAYSSRNKVSTSAIIKAIVKEFENERVIILGRYLSQIKSLNQTFGKKAKVLKKVVDGKSLLQKTDVFVGSGGTMTAEAALLGVPTISYNAVPNFIEDYLVREKLVNRETNPVRIVRIIKQLMELPENRTKAKAKRILDSMEDPYAKLVKAIK